MGTHGYKGSYAPLRGKTIAISGTTGGLGQELCRLLAAEGASLILLNRSAERAEKLRTALTEEFSVSVRCITVDLADVTSVKRAVNALRTLPVDILIHNAGAYDIPRCKTALGYDNVYQINFLSPYYLTKELLPLLRERGGHVVVVGSIAHNYARSDPRDVDFSTRRRASKVYGNAKRYLMFATEGLLRSEERVSLAVTHPGISLTGITAHYPRWIFALIKYPMKVIFMHPKKACLSVLEGVHTPTSFGEWIGPRFFDVWGMPKRKPLRTATAEEKAEICRTAERIYLEWKNM